ncbi:MAG TPA: nuclear transport factor 2 family protein [Candidatus Binatia bacterium]|jgi:3-phenylpropionate/cinnamic acid dioxygenase small subunit|nr:nuclear transport factor 2 family protein [Candidatus Binatia bacterium]
MSDQEKLQLLLDRMEITELVQCYATGVDSRDWKLFRSIFTDEIEVWLGSASVGQAALRKVNADKFTERASRIIGRFAVTQHLLSNHRIEVKDDEATCVVYMQARHFPRQEEASQAVWDIGGYYTHHLARTAAGWKIAKYTLTVTWTENTPPDITL